MVGGSAYPLFLLPPDTVNTPILGGLTDYYFCEISTILSQFRVKVINILAMLQV